MFKHYIFGGIAALIISTQLIVANTFAATQPQVSQEQKTNKEARLKATLAWPMLPKESVASLAVKLYPNNTSVQQTFIFKTLRLNEAQGIHLSASQVFDAPRIVLIPAPSSIQNLIRPIKSSSEPTERLAAPKLMMSYGMEVPKNIAPIEVPVAPPKALPQPAQKAPQAAPVSKVVKEAAPALPLSVSSPVTPSNQPAVSASVANPPSVEPSENAPTDVKPAEVKPTAKQEKKQVDKKPEQVAETHEKADSTFSLPTFNLPDIKLPTFTWPSIQLPNFEWPTIDTTGVTKTLQVWLENTKNAFSVISANIITGATEAKDSIASLQLPKFDASLPINNNQYLWLVAVLLGVVSLISLLLSRKAHQKKDALLKEAISQTIQGKDFATLLRENPLNIHDETPIVPSETKAKDEVEPAPEAPKESGYLAPTFAEPTLEEYGDHLILEEARAYEKNGQIDEAIEHIKWAIRAEEKAPIELWHYILDLFRKQNNREEFENYAKAVHQIYNESIAQWDAQNLPLVVADSMEDFPHVLSKLCKLWPGKVSTTKFLNQLIEDNRHAERSGFSRAVVDEILLLTKVLESREDAAPEVAQAEPEVKVTAPASDTSSILEEVVEKVEEAESVAENIPLESPIIQPISDVTSEWPQLEELQLEENNPQSSEPTKPLEEEHKLEEPKLKELTLEDLKLEDLTLEPPTPKVQAKEEAPTPAPTTLNTDLTNEVLNKENQTRENEKKDDKSLPKWI